MIASALTVLVLHLADLRPWSDVAGERVSWYRKEHCELVDTSGFFLQFWNFWSNYGYLASGLLLLCLSNTWLGRGVGVTFVFLAFGSAGFHGTLTEFGQDVDIAGVYAALLGVVAYGLVELLGLDDDWPAWSIMAALVGFGIVAGFVRTDVDLFDSDIFVPILVGLIVIGMVVGLVRHASTALIFPGAVGVLGAGLLALLFKFTDGAEKAADCLYGPDSVIQGHALWHLFSGFMFLGMFEFFRSLRGRWSSVLPWSV